MKFFFGLFILCLLLVGCRSEECFVGNVQIFNQNTTTTKPTAQNLGTFPLYSELFAVYDTVLISYNQSHKGHAFHLYGLNSKKEISAHFPFGHGSNEYISLQDIRNIYIENNEGKTTIYDFNQNKVFAWNIPKSIETGTTVVEQQSNLPSPSTPARSYSRVQILGNDTLFAYTPSARQTLDGNFTLPQYYLINKATGKPITEIFTVEKTIENPKSGLLPEMFFSSYSQVKPDRTKFVESMSFLAQINIADLKTGEVKSFRAKNTPDCSLFEGSMKDPVLYYRALAANNNVILALWAGKPLSKYHNDSECVHVFDWDGNFIAKAKLPIRASYMWLDPKSDLLYTFNSATEEICRYKIADLVPAK